MENLVKVMENLEIDELEEIIKLCESGIKMIDGGDK